MFRQLTVLTISIFIFLNAGCAGDKMAPEPQSLSSAHWFEMGIGKKTIRIQIVATRQEMARGLMERKELRTNDGMLFPYSSPRKATFWMKNTPLPLDIGYFDANGILREIYPLHPYDETTVASRSDQIQFALEMNQGWYSQNKIRPGAALDLKLLSTALEARGFNPAAFGLPSVETDKR